jgi:hypothetical protein
VAVVVPTEGFSRYDKADSPSGFYDPQTGKELIRELKKKLRSKIQFLVVNAHINAIRPRRQQYEVQRQHPAEWFALAHIALEHVENVKALPKEKIPKAIFFFSRIPLLTMFPPIFIDFLIKKRIKRRTEMIKSHFFILNRPLWLSKSVSYCKGSRNQRKAFQGAAGRF